MPAKKSWTEKLLDDRGLPRVEEITERMSRRWGTGTVAIPAPIEVDELMVGVPEGKVTTINEIRAAVARKHGATIGCPMTCGIFAWVAAHAAEERRLKGEKRITPYWRTLKAGGEINAKYPGGVEAQRRLLEMEGHRIVKRGKRFLVEDLEESLVKFVG